MSLIDSDSIPSKIIKRDGRVVEFDRQKITEAIWKAIKSVGGQDRALAERLSNQVVERLGKQLKPGEIPHVEQVQDLVEKILVENNLYNVAKAYILYRALHAQIREFVDSYLENKSWLVKENANTTYSLQALNFHISSQVISQYWLHRIFNKGRTEIREAHLNGDFHIHNLGILGPYCFDDQTRVLTKEGFKFFKDVTLQDEVATVNLKTGYLEYQHPIDKQVFEYSGPLFCFESRSLSLRVTPEHRLLVRERGDKKWKFINPTNFKRRSEFLKQVKWRGENSKFFQIPVVKGGNRLRHIKRIPMEVFLKFMGWYLAEGNAWRHDRKDRNSPDYIISIGQRNKKNRREIASLIKRLGFSPNLSEKDHIQFCSKELYFYLKQFGKSDEKFVPRFIKDLDPEKIEIFLSALFKGDGTIENGKLRRFSTRSKKLAEDVLECLLKIGKSGTLRWDGERFIVSVQTKQLTPIFNKHPKLVQYKGKVYDLTVPNGTLLVERNGRVVVSGNCVGWDLRDLLMTGFRGVRGKVSAKPAKHFRVALGHVVNFVFTLQGEAAGAQAFSNFDTYLAPFIRHDGLDYKSVKQALQEFMFNMNIPTRVGFQSLCWDEPIVIKEGGKVKVVEIGRLVDREFEKYPYRVIEKHPQSYALENHDDYQVLSFNPDGKAVWTRVKAFVRHRVPKNSEFVRIRTNRGEARVSKAHSLFSFSRFNGEFNPVPKSAEDVKIADDYRHLNEENHFIALRSLENQGRKEEIDLVEIIDELPRLQKNVFVKINPTHTLKRVRERIILEEQSLVPFYKEFGIKDRGIWESWLKEKSIRYDVWRKYGDLSQKVEFKLKNSDVWYPRFLNGKLLENFVKLCAWYISEGHTAISTPLYVSQPPSKNARDIIKLLRALNALGQVARGKGYSRNGRKTKTVLEITGRGLLAEVVSRTCGYLSFNKVVPWFIFNLSPKYQKIFIKTLLKGDGSEYSKYWDYLTTSRKLSTSLSLLLSQNNFRFAVYTEKLNRNNKNWRDRFVIRIFKENSKPKKTYFVNDFEARICLGVEKFNYDKEYEYDISVDLPQENFIGGAGLLVFHNTPFSNVTLDLKVPGFMRDEPVIIGGEVLDATYGEFQEEMNIFNRALAEVMLEGDAVGRVFTFPIPTINITRDFEWNDETTRTVLETSAKYGIPYFANFINSDMNPEDVRSMCLHPDEELLIRNSGSVRRETIGQVVEKYAGEFKNDGWADPVKEVEVLSLNPETWKTEWVKVKRFLKVTDNKMIKIVTEDGKTIRVSRNHLIPVVTINGIVNKLAKDVKPGDIVLTLKSSCHALATNYEKIGSFVLDEKLAELLGFFTADGNYLFENRKNLKTYRLPKGLQFTFGNNNPLLRKKVKKLIKDVLKCSVREKEDTRYDTRYFYVYSTDIARAFYNAGFKKYGRLPQVIFNSPPTVIKAFLKYFFLGDGYERNKEIHLNDRELARDLAILFTILGIPVCYKEKRKSQRIYIQHKKSKINSIGNQATPTLFERVPGRMAKSTYAVPGLNKSRMVGVETLSKYDAHTKESKKFINGDIMFVRVKKCELIELEKEQEFFDVELERNHLFIHSLGNITHNCCHLRLDKRELKKRGGGLFGANPLTGCYDEETEILTTKGWKKFKDLTLEDEIFTRKQDGTIEIHKPIRIFEYDWDGEMIRFKHKSLDLLVTPNHRMFVEYRDGKVWRNKFVEAKDFNPNSHRIPKQGVWNGNEEEYFVLPSVEILSGTGPVSRFSKEELEAIRKLKTEGVSIYQIAENFDCDPVTVYNICTKEKYGNEERTRVRYETQPLKIKMDDWLKFFGIWLTEGSVDNENIAAEHGYRIFITQVNRKKRKEIKELLDRLPFNYREEARSFVICNKQLWNYLRQFGNKYEKYIPQEIKNLSARQLKILFDWMVKGNGHIRKTTGQTTYWTSSDRLAADMQEIILKIGMISSIRKSKKRAKIKGRIINTEKCWTIGVQKSKYYRLRKRNISKVYYKGKVYCVEVPNHVIMVRRNGKSCWCGNSIGVVTINMPRIGFLSKSEGEFFARLDRMMVLAKDVLEIKRKWLEKFTEAGLYPYSRFYLRHIKEAFGQYWKNHFSTIGLIGMNEACLNFLGCSIGDPEGLSFTIKVLDYMRKRLQDFQEETGSIYNLEATPAEGTSHRLARIDKKTYPSIIVANEEEVKKGAAPYYTNSTHLPVYYTDDLWEYLRLQDPLQTKYTGGTVAHVWLGESNPPVESVASLVRKICENFKLPYFTLTPTFSICPEDGYLSGEQHTCPKCGRTTEVYSRVVGYLRPVEQWNQGKQEEFKQRKVFDKALVRKLSVSIASDA